MYKERGVNREAEASQLPEEVDNPWIALLEDCTQAEGKLKALSKKLKRQRWVKQKLLGKASYEQLQRAMAQASIALQKVVKAIQEAPPDAEKAWQRLETAIQQLAAQQTALQTGWPDPPEVGLVNDLILLSAPFIAACYNLLKSGPWSRAWLLIVLLTLGLLFLVGPTYRQLVIRVHRAQIAEKRMVEEIIDRVLKRFKEREEKMSLAQIFKVEEQNKMQSAQIFKVEEQNKMQSAQILAVEKQNNKIQEEVHAMTSKLDRLEGTMERLLEAIIDKKKET